MRIGPRGFVLRILRVPPASPVSVYSQLTPCARAAVAWHGWTPLLPYCGIHSRFCSHSTRFMPAAARSVSCSHSFQQRLLPALFWAWHCVACIHLCRLRRLADACLLSVACARWDVAQVYAVLRSACILMTASQERTEPAVWSFIHADATQLYHSPHCCTRWRTVRPAPRTFRGFPDWARCLAITTANCLAPNCWLAYCCVGSCQRRVPPRCGYVHLYHPGSYPAPPVLYWYAVPSAAALMPASRPRTISSARRLQPIPMLRDALTFEHSPALRMPAPSSAV